MKQALRASIVLLFAAFSFGCGSDNPVQPGNVAGIYYSSEFVTTGTGGQTNQLLAGSYVNIQLLPNGSTIGQLHLVASSSNPALDADLAGSWSQSGNTVTFTQSADTFIRNMTFTVVPSGTSWELVGDHVFAGTRVQLTLSQGGII